MTQVASLWCSVWLMIARWFQPNPSNINWLSWSIPKKSKQIGNVKSKIKIWNHQPVCAPHATFPPSSIKICSCSVLSFRSFASPGPSSPCTSEPPKTSTGRGMWRVIEQQIYLLVNVEPASSSQNGGWRWREPLWLSCSVFPEKPATESSSKSSDGSCNGMKCCDKS